MGNPPTVTTPTQTSKHGNQLVLLGPAPAPAHSVIKQAYVRGSSRARRRAPLSPMGASHARRRAQNQLTFICQPSHLSDKDEQIDMSFECVILELGNHSSY